MKTMIAAKNQLTHFQMSHVISLIIYVTVTLFQENYSMAIRFVLNWNRSNGRILYWKPFSLFFFILFAYRLSTICFAWMTYFVKQVKPLFAIHFYTIMRLRWKDRIFYSGTWEHAQRFMKTLISNNEIHRRILLNTRVYEWRIYMPLFPDGKNYNIKTIYRHY